MDALYKQEKVIINNFEKKTNKTNADKFRRGGQHQCWKVGHGPVAVSDSLTHADNNTATTQSLARPFCLRWAAERKVCRLYQLLLILNSSLISSI